MRTLLDKHCGSGALGIPDRLIDFWHLLEKQRARDQRENHTHVKATCRSPRGTSHEASSARWKHAIGEHILKLRALSLSDCWEHAMDVALRASPVYAKGCRVISNRATPRAARPLQFAVRLALSLIAI